MGNYGSLCDLFLLQFAVCQICITTSTSANLEQILPWIFYHKVIGVSNFFLFVEGKAASANVTKVLESIPVSLKFFISLLYFTTQYLFVFGCCTLCQFNSLLFIFLNFAFMDLTYLVQGVKVIYRTRELEEQQAKRFVHSPLKLYSSVCVCLPLLGNSLIE